MGSKRRIVVGAVVLALAVAGFAALKLRDPGNVKRFEFYAAPLADADYAALGARPGWQTRVLEVEPGVSLRGLVLPPKTESAPWVLFFPGNSATLLAEAQPFLESLRGTRDFGIAVYAYRGFDGSTGTPGSEAILRDGTAIYERMRTSPELKQSKLHLLSFSLGTAIASSVAAGTTEASRPASVTLLAPLTEIDVGEKSPFARFQKGERFETLRFLGQVAGPALVVHGELDQAFPVQMGRDVKQALGARARYLELPGVGHMDLLKDPRTLDAVRAQLDVGP